MPAMNDYGDVDRRQNAIQTLMGRMNMVRPLVPLASIFGGLLVAMPTSGKTVDGR